MISQKLRKVGNSYVVTIPKAGVAGRGSREGQLVAIEVQPLEVRPVGSADLSKAFDESWERNKAGYQYLAGR